LQSFYYLISYSEGGPNSSLIHAVKGQKAGGRDSLTFCDSVKYTYTVSSLSQNSYIST